MRGIRALTVVLLATYPFIVYFGLEHLGPAALASLLGGLLLLRFAAFQHGSSGAGHNGVLILAAMGVTVFVLAVWLSADDRLLKSYPVLVNAALFILFAGSLLRPPTVIERGLRLAGRAVPPEAPPYLWWVTLAWCGFFLVNGTIAAWTAVAAPLAWWTLYNGLLSYLLIAALFGAELITRRIYRRRVAGGAHD